MAARKEIRSLTGLRGVAALYVVGLHFTGGMHTNTFVVHGYLAVDLFFVLSGFVMAMNYQKMFASGWSLRAYFTFLGRRVARVYPLYLVCTLVAFLLVCWGVLPWPMKFGPKGIALGMNLSMVQAWGWGAGGSFDMPAWSISAEWAAYLVFPLLLVPSLFSRRVTAWCFGAICVVALVVLCSLPPGIRQASDPTSLLDLPAGSSLTLIRCIAEFSLGLLSFRVAETPFGELLGASRWMAPALCVLLLLLLAVPRTDLPIALLFPVLMICIASGTHGVNRILSSGVAEFLGIMSYSVYLTHQLLGPLLYWMQIKGAAMGIAHAHAYAYIVRLALVFPVAMLANRLIEIPGRRWLRVLFEGDGVKPVKDNPMIPG